MQSGQRIIHCFLMEVKTKKYSGLKKCCQWTFLEEMGILSLAVMKNLSDKNRRLGKGYGILF